MAVAELLLDAKVDVNHQTNNGSTALMFACKYSNVEVAKLLLERGADKTLRDNNGDANNLLGNRAVRKEELLALLARY